MLKIYCIKDVKVGFMNPFYLQSDDIAIRTFTKAVNEKTPNAVNDFPKDKELYLLGEYDEVTGKITGSESPVLLLRGIDCEEEKKSVSIEELEISFNRVKSMLEVLSKAVTEKVQDIDKSVVSKVAGMAKNLANQNKIKRILRGN